MAVRDSGIIEMEKGHASEAMHSEQIDHNSTVESVQRGEPQMIWKTCFVIFVFNWHVWLRFLDRASYRRHRSHPRCSLERYPSYVLVL